MRNLPSEQKALSEAAIAKFRQSGELIIQEPCDCGARIRHNNGGNYHSTITLRRDGDVVFAKFDDTCELTPAAQWQECAEWQDVIREYSDWL